MALLLAACDDPAGPGDDGEAEPAAVEVAGGGDAVGMVGMPLGSAPAVRVTDAEGEPVAGVSVEWTVVSGGGSIEAVAAATDDDGLAEARWTLGPDPVGVASVPVSVAGDLLFATRSASALDPHGR